MKKIAALQKVAKITWGGPSPEEMEDAYEGTNLHKEDRKILENETKKVRSKQTGLKKWMLQHPVLSAVIPGVAGAALGAGLGSFAKRRGEGMAIGGYIGGATGLIGGGLTHSVMDVNESSKVEDAFQKNNPKFMNRYYKNPQRSSYRLKRDEVAQRGRMNDLISSALLFN